MKKRISMTIMVFLLLIVGGCVEQDSAIHPTLFLVPGDYASYTEVNEKFIIIDSRAELEEIINTIVIENQDYVSQYNHIKTYFSKNDIGFLKKIDDYQYLFEDDSEQWFEENRLVFCVVTTTSSGYQAEVSLKETKDGKLTLILNKFNNYTGAGDDEIKTFKLFIPISVSDLDNLNITLDGKPVTYFEKDHSLFEIDYENISDEELEFVAKNNPKYPYNLGLINGKQYGRVVSSSSSSPEDAIEVVTNHFTNNNYPFSINTVVEVWIDIETEVFYGVYVKWEHNSSGKKSYYDEYVISFKKDIFDCRLRNVYNDEDYFLVKTNNPDQIRQILDILYYNNTYNISGSKLLKSEVLETEDQFIYQSYGTRVVYGDWGMKDKVSLLKEIWTINKASGELNLTSTNLIKKIFVDGELTHY